MSRNAHDTTEVSAIFLSANCWSKSTASIADLCFLPPIWLGWRTLGEIFARYEILSEKILFRSFDKHEMNESSLLCYAELR